ncbi:MAG: hypothetical protein CMI18_10515 [Opitutaceae bacterium]|nr:hypothetical protein [Opitutaceae bacterium]
MNTKTLPVLSIATLAYLIQPLTAGEWSRWHGPNGDNIVEAAKNFNPDLNNWKISWQEQVGLGYATVTTADGRAYTMGHDGESSETIVCFDAATGKKIWDYTYQGDLIPKMHVGGPNASVVIDGNNAYAISKDGQVINLNAKNGKKNWSAKLIELLEIELPNWGFGSSAVVYKGDILISAGKTIALDKRTGEPSWISNVDRAAGYGTPVVFTKSGKDYIAATDADGISILNASNGKEIGRHDQKVQYNLNATTATMLNDEGAIFFHNNTNSAVLDFDGKSLTEKWSDRKLKNPFTSSVKYGNSLYGLNGKQGSSAILYSLNTSTGEHNWEVRDYGFASLIGVGETLLILTEDGNLITAPANAKEYKEISRKKLIDKTCWTNPTYAGGKIYIRNDQGILICLTPA